MRSCTDGALLRYPATSGSIPSRYLISDSTGGFRASPVGLAGEKGPLGARTEPIASP